MRLREVLGYRTDLQYITIGGDVPPWTNSNNSSGEDLRFAMAENSYLRAMIRAGYQDGATDYFMYLPRQARDHTGLPLTSAAVIGRGGGVALPDALPELPTRRDGMCRSR